MSSTKFVNSGVLLFIDLLLVAASGWIYWIIISKLTPSSEIGQATTIFSLVTMIGGLTQLGLEYPLLKKSSSNQSQILATTITIELIITLVTVPIILFVMDSVFHQSLQGFTIVAIGMLIISSTGFVPRFVLLGISKVKPVIVMDIVGIGVKFLVGYVTVSMGFGASGILWSYLLSSLVITIATLVISIRIFGLKIGNGRYAKELLRDGLANTPSKLSRMLVLSLSVVLLGSFGLTYSDIGKFYMALMVSIVAGGLAASIAFMVLPASSVAQKDLSNSSARIGLSLSAPLIAALMASPASILALIGPEYPSVSTTLFVLSIAILPTTIVYNAISKFNTLNKNKQLITIGTVEIVTFLVAFWVLVPLYQTFGAALAILIAFTASSIPSILWSERSLIRYIGASGLAIVAGWLPTFFVGSFLQVHPGLIVGSSIAIAFATILALRNTSMPEMMGLVRSLVKRT